MAFRNAARVLPEPVGAAIRVWRPERMASQPWDWAGVGSPNRSANQRETAGWKVEGDTTELYSVNRDHTLKRRHRLPRLPQVPAVMRHLERDGGPQLVLEPTGERRLDLHRPKVVAVELLERSQQVVVELGELGQHWNLR